MSLPDSFDDVITRLRDGDSEAATEIFHRFAARLIALARTRLDSRVRQKVDPEDVVQSVFRSFFIRQDHFLRAPNPRGERHERRI